MKTRGSKQHLSVSSLLISVTFLSFDPLSPLLAQQAGTIQGTVTRADVGSPIHRVRVAIAGTNIATLTDREGRYVIRRVQVGQYTLIAQWLGFRPQEATVTVTSGGTHVVDLALEPQPIVLSDVIVETATRAPERVVEAPAAISVVDQDYANDVSIAGQMPRALTTVPGVDVVQSGMHDYNINARGFNSSLNRRVLVLQDGRDVHAATFGFSEWTTLTSPLSETGRIEMVRGPGSALYGANAYSGVINITTPAAREQIGTNLTLGGGELSTMRADLQHAGVVSDGRVGYKVNVGFNRSDSWTRSRTSGDGGDLRREYADAIEQPAPEGIDAVPLFGQTLDPATRTALGDPDPVLHAYGSARLDYYLDDGSVATVEGGSAYAANTTLVSGIGRVQNDEVLRPWARAMWAAPRFNVMAWYSGRETLEPLQSLSTGLDIETHLNAVHGEAQYNQPFLNDRARLVVGASLRSDLIDSDGTLLEPENETRNWYYSGFGQLEFELTPQLRVVGAARFDDGTLFDPQFSPKGAVVFSPTDEQSVRFSVNRAFQTPSHLEYFTLLPAGLPADFSALEAGLRASPLGPALAGVPNGELFTTSSGVPVLALGNNDLEVEKVTSFEVGYKGLIADRVFLTLDGFYSRLTNFVTDLLPGVNPTYPAWTAPEAVPEAVRETLEQTVRDQLLAANQALAAAGLTRLQDGSTAIVVSYANAGKVDEYGVEVGLGVAVTPELRLDGTYSLFEFDVDSTTVLPGDELKPNTPKHKGTVSASYQGVEGFDLRVTGRLVDGYDWAAGVFVGPIPSSQTFDVSLGYRVNDLVRFHALATNVFDQRRYHIYGGSVIGRRVLGGVTMTF